MEYINSLSLDVIEIDISYNNLSILPDLSKFTRLQKLDCSYNQFIFINIILMYFSRIIFFFLYF